MDIRSQEKMFHLGLFIVPVLVIDFIIVLIFLPSALFRRLYRQIACSDGIFWLSAIPFSRCGSFARATKACISGLCFAKQRQSRVSPLKFTRIYMPLPKSRPNPAAHCSHSETDSSQTKRHRIQIGEDTERTKPKDHCYETVQACQDLPQ